MDSHDPLISIHGRRRSCCHDNYRPSCVRSKGAVFILILCFFAFTIVTNLIALIAITSKYNIPTLVFGIFAIVCLSFPFLGLLGEKWMRYKVIIIGYLILCISYIILILSEVCGLIIYITSQNFTWEVYEIYVVIIITVTAVFPFLGLCLFQANIIQFGTDQLQFEPSEELSSFVYWFIWVYALSNFFYSLYNGTIVSKLFTDNPVVTSVVPVIVCILFVVTGFFCICCFKRYLVIEPAQHNNPVKLIWRVMRYAWKHKQPVRRSAFTYGEPPPSRLDLGKERYGGPFTTDEIESVKCFWNILPIIFGTIVVSFVESNLYLCNYVFNSKIVSECIFLNYPAIIPYGVVVVGIPIHQLLIVPYFSRYIPSMLKRIWIGLVLVLVQLVVMTISTSRGSFNDCYENMYVGSGLSPSKESDVTQHILIVLQCFEGISIMLVFTGSLEFILAQTPRTMQGILIGLRLMQYYFIWSLNELVLSYLNCYQHWWVTYYAVITCFALILLIVYTIAAYKYKYRLRNELSDVNERVIITQYTERQLDREEQLHRNETEISYHIESMVIN